MKIINIILVSAHKDANNFYRRQIDSTTHAKWHDKMRSQNWVQKLTNGVHALDGSENQQSPLRARPFINVPAVFPTISH